MLRETCDGAQRAVDAARKVLGRQAILSERLAFIIAVWIAMVVGVAVVAYTLWQRDFLFGLLLGFFVWRCIQQWQEFRNSGIIGD